MNSDVLVKNTWYIVGLSGDFENSVLHGQVVAERPIVLWRTGEGRLVAFDDRCCHKRMPLSAGKLVDGGLLQCAYHGLCYDASGACVRVPAHPDGHIPPQAKLREIPVMEQDGLVWVWPGDRARAQGTMPPRTPEVVSPDWDTADVKGPVPVPTNSLLLIENLLDITHFFPLHDGNIGDVENSRIPVKLEEGVKDGNAFVGTVREVSGYRQPPFLEEYFGYDVVDRHHTHFMVNPGLTRVQMRVWPNGRMGDAASERGYVILHAHTPVDRRNHVWRLIVNLPKGLMCKSDPAKPVLKQFVETFPAVMAEDHWALEKQQKMFDYPDEGYSEVFLRTDAALRRARQLLAKMERADAPAPREAVA